MKRSAFIFIFLFAYAFSFAQTPWDGKSEIWSMGDGSEENPFQIEKPQHLAYLSEQVNAQNTFKGKFFKLMNHLDMGGASTPMMKFPPIGGLNSNLIFQGVFEGNNKELQNLVIDIDGYNNKYDIGLFGILDSMAVVKNLFITKDSRLRGYHFRLGSICGRNKGVIKNCHVSVKINASDYVGGIVGLNEGLIDSCSNRQKIMARQYLGGIAGENRGIISHCYNTRNVEAGSDVGGIAGLQDSVNACIYLCYNTGTILSGPKSTLGGIVGTQRRGSVHTCFNIGKIFSMTESKVGGIAGYVLQGEIHNTYNSGEIGSEGMSSKDFLGGLVGQLDSLSYISKSYNKGNVTGGFLNEQSVGLLKGKAEDIYFDKQICIGSQNTGTGLLSSVLCSGDSLKGLDVNTWVFQKGQYPCLASLQNAASTFSSAAIILYHNTTDSLEYDMYDAITQSFTFKAQSPAIWKIAFGGSFAQIKEDSILIRRSQTSDEPLVMELFGINEGDTLKQIINLTVLMQINGSGTARNPWQIENRTHLNHLSKSVNDGKEYKDKYFIMTQDIDMGAASALFIPIGGNGSMSKQFKGHFDGNHHQIKNLYIHTDQKYIGLFGFLGKGSSVKNLSIVSGKIKGGESTGAIAGECYGSMENCHNHAEVLGTVFVGGLVGFYFNQYGGDMKYCHNTGNVAADAYVCGGIIGGGDVPISFCFNMGNVSCKSHSAGGIAGTNSGKMEFLYNVGNIKGESYIGGVVGRKLDSVLLHAYNAGFVSGNSRKGGVAGAVDFGGHLKECYYDKQMCEEKGLDGKDVLGQAEGRLSKEILIQENLIGFDTAYWLFTTHSYPALKSMQNLITSSISTACILFFENDTLIETSQNIKSDFTPLLKEGIEWASDDTSVVSHLGQVKRPNGQHKNLFFTAKGEGFSKKIPLRILRQGKFNVVIATPEHGSITVSLNGTDLPAESIVDIDAVLQIRTTAEETYKLAAVKVNGIAISKNTVIVNTDLFIEAIFEPILDIEHKDISPIQVYTQGRNIIIPNTTDRKIESVKIYDAIGRLMVSSTENHKTYSLSTSGIYIVQIKEKNKAVQVNKLMLP